MHPFKHNVMTENCSTRHMQIIIYRAWFYRLEVVQVNYSQHNL